MILYAIELPPWNNRSCSPIYILSTACVHGAGGVRLHPESDPDGEEEGRRRKEDHARQERQGRRGRQSGERDSGFPGDFKNSISQMDSGFPDEFSPFQSPKLPFLCFFLSFQLTRGNNTSSSHRVHRVGERSGGSTPFEQAFETNRDSSKFNLVCSFGSNPIYPEHLLVMVQSIL